VDWFAPTAATRATSSADGHVTARIVLVKGVDQDGLLFFTNYDSPKGRQLTENPRAALVLYWPHLERQVRVEGRVGKISREASNEYFHSRPRGSQIGAVVSAQSQVIADRLVLEQRAAELEQQLAGAEVPLPDYWGGYRLEPDCLEFWQGRENRLHDRFRYRRQAGLWLRERLAP
jgi:pyridoxamine 5'-phosphate oxidase